MILEFLKNRELCIRTTLLTSVERTGNTGETLAYVSKGFNFLTSGQIIEKSNRLQIETILQIVLKFQFDGAGFHRAEANANVGISNTNIPT